MNTNASAGNEQPQPTSTKKSANFTPQLKLAEDGSLILNEESLIIQREESEPIFDSTVVENEQNDNLTYNSYRKFHHTKKWSPKGKINFLFRKNYL